MNYRLENYGNIKEIAKLALDIEQNNSNDSNGLGSELFKLEGKLDDKFLAKFDEKIKQALQFLVEDGLVKGVVVASKITKNDKNRINYTIKLIQPDNTEELMQAVWEDK